MVIMSATFATEVSAFNYTNTTSVQTASLKLLAKGSENDFVAFMEKKATKFAKSPEWADFVEVITLYNQNPAVFAKLSTEKREKFNYAVIVLNQKLGKMKGAEVNAWKENVNFTANTINFLWKQLNNTEDSVVEQETIEVITMIPSM